MKKEKKKVETVGIVVKKGGEIKKGAVKLVRKLPFNLWVIRLLSFIFLIAGLNQGYVLLSLIGVNIGLTTRLYFWLIASVNLVAFGGLWHLKRYGRIAAIIITLIYTLSQGFVEFINMALQQEDYLRLLGALFSLILCVYFAVNRKPFLKLSEKLEENKAG